MCARSGTGRRCEARPRVLRDSPPEYSSNSRPVSSRPASSSGGRF
jgi:hypothetical protein